jgi:hypothetical protein
VWLGPLAVGLQPIGPARLDRLGELFDAIGQSAHTGLLHQVAELFGSDACLHVQVVSDVSKQLKDGGHLPLGR